MTRLDRPEGDVVIEGGGDLVVVARLNRLLRSVRSRSAEQRPLADCFAPDFILLIRPGQKATLPAHRDQTLLSIRVRPESVLSLTGQALPRSLPSGQPLADRFLTDLIERAFEADGPRLEALMRVLFAELVAARPSGRNGAAKGGLSLADLARLRGHVESNLSGPLATTELAAVVSLSPFHFSRAFKTSMGVAPAKWIRLRRLTVAQTLLTDPSRSVIDVAATVGYESPSRFAGAFRELTGLTPSAWRQAARRPGD